MITKYAILKSNGCHGYWTYMSKPRGHSITGSNFRERFIGNDVKDTVMFDSEKEAEEYLSNATILEYGIFRIEKIYLINKKLENINIPEDEFAQSEK